MSNSASWRNAVRVVRGASIDQAMASPAGGGRATAFDFTGTGGKPWVGFATVKPGLKTGTHNHGHHEVMIYVVKGRSEIRWGESLEYAADIGPGDLAYFSPNVPHQEFNPHAEDTVYLVVRSDSERIVNQLEEKPAAMPEKIA